MPEPQDAATPQTPVTVTPPPGRRWVFSGGDEDDASVTLDVVTFGAAPRTFRVRVGLDVAADGTLAADVTVEEQEP